MMSKVATMTWDIDSIARLLTEDPDVPASPEAMDIKAKAGEIGGGDPTSTTQVRQQMEKQRKLRQQEQRDQQKKLDPFFQDLEDTEGDLDTLSQTMQQQQAAQQQAVDQMGRRVPDISKALKGIRGNLPQ